MSTQSFFAVAMLLSQPENSITLGWEHAEIKKQIILEYLNNKQDLIKLKQALASQRLDGSPWETAKDEVVLEEYLTTLSARKLKQLLQALKLKTMGGIDGLPVAVTTLIRLLTPIINFATQLFNRGVSGLTGTFTYFGDAEKRGGDLDADLTVQERIRSAAYSQLFVEAAQENRKYNQLYREILAGAKSQEQVLGGLLRYIKQIKQAGQAEEANKMLLKIEKTLFAGRTFKDPETINALEVAIRNNLEQAYQLTKATKLTGNSLLVQEPQNCFAQAEQVALIKINNAVGTVKALIMQILDYDEKLEKSPLTKAERDKISELMFDYKRKILHFFIKTMAFAKEETLLPNVYLTDPYVDQQGNSYENYFEFWLTKVPALSPKVTEQGEEQPKFQHKMLLEQFNHPPKIARPTEPSPQARTPERAAVTAAVTLACATISDLADQKSNYDNVICSLQEQLTSITTAATSSAGQPAFTESLSAVNQFRRQSLKEIITQKSHQRAVIANELSLLQQKVIDYIISFSHPGEENITWQQVQRYLAFNGIPAQAIEQIREGFNEYMAAIPSSNAETKVMVEPLVTNWQEQQMQFIDSIKATRDRYYLPPLAQQTTGPNQQSRSLCGVYTVN